MAAWSGVGPGLVGDVAAEFELKGGMGQVEVAAQAALQLVGDGGCVARGEVGVAKALPPRR